MDKRLLDICVCPVTQLPLQVLDGERLAELNTAIQAGGIRNHAAEAVSLPIAEALVTRNGRLVYPVREGLPILLEEESIDWQQLGH